MNQKRIIAEPTMAIHHEKDGYFVRARVIDGPLNTLNRSVLVKFDMWQLETLAMWDGKPGTSVSLRMEKET